MVRPFLSWAEGDDVWLRRARVPGCLLEGAAAGVELVDCDIHLVRGRIGWIGPCEPGAGVDLGRGMVLPGLVDLHTHLDKGHIWGRASNPDGTLAGALAAVRADREAHWTERDVAARAGFALRCAYAHGTVAVRTHLDSQGGQLDVSWPVFEQLRADWAGRIALQAACLVPIEFYETAEAERMADVVAGAGGLLGGAGTVQPGAAGHIRRIFDLAVDRGLDVDLHADETEDPAAQTLRLVALETIRRGWEGRVTCGHCCSLAMQDPAVAAETVALVAAAEITVVCLPMVNLYLQGRVAGGTPRWRGVTLVHELRAAGVRVVLASDNTRDPFHAFGDLDLVEVFREGVRIGHLDMPLGGWVGAVTREPAAVMGVAGGRLVVGGVADLVVFSGRDYGELLARAQGDRVVVRGGRVVDVGVPDYRELDLVCP